MVVEATNKKQFGRNRGIPKTQLGFSLDQNQDLNKKLFKHKLLNLIIEKFPRKLTFGIGRG